MLVKVHHHTKLWGGWQWWQGSSPHKALGWSFPLVDGDSGDKVHYLTKLWGGPFPLLMVTMVTRSITSQSCGVVPSPCCWQLWWQGPLPHKAVGWSLPLVVGNNGDKVHYLTKLWGGPFPLLLVTMVTRSITSQSCGVVPSPCWWWLWWQGPLPHKAVGWFLPLVVGNYGDKVHYLTKLWGGSSPLLVMTMVTSVMTSSLHGDRSVARLGGSSIIIYLYLFSFLFVQKCKTETIFLLKSIKI